MKNINGLSMTWKEFDDLIGLISNGGAGIACESGEWFYLESEDYFAKDINGDLSKHFNRKVKDVLIDLCKEDECVVIVFE